MADWKHFDFLGQAAYSTKTEKHSPRKTEMTASNSSGGVLHFL